MSPDKQTAQFANLLHAAPVAPKARKADKIWSIKGLLDEVCRVPNASQHVPNPRPPQWLFGSREVVESRALTWHAQARKGDGKARYQKTSPALACCVVSLPRVWIQRWPAYRDATVAYFRRMHGERLAGVVEHEDERHPHLHIYLVPLHGEDFGSVHPGYRASRLARKQPGNKVGTAFRQAMKEWQDRFYSAVSRLHGLARVGPQRRRLERTVWRILDNAAAKAKQMRAEAEAVAAEGKRRAAALAKAEEATRKEHARLIGAAQHLELKQQRLEATGEARLLKDLEELQAKFELVNKQLNEACFRERMQEEARSQSAALRAAHKPMPS